VCRKGRSGQGGGGEGGGGRGDEQFPEEGLIFAVPIFKKLLFKCKYYRGKRDPL